MVSSTRSLFRTASRQIKGKFLRNGPWCALAGRGGLRAGGTQGAELAQQAEPELSAGDHGDDHDEEAGEDEQQLRGGIAVPAEDPAPVPPVAPRGGQRTVANGTPADRQAGRGRRRQLALETGQAFLLVLAGTRRGLCG